VGVARVVDPQGREFEVVSDVGAPGSVVHVLVHGIGMSHRSLSRLHAQLARSATVHSIDLPGFGGLPRPSAVLDIETMAAALGRVVAGLGAEKVVIIGHSMGAQWAVELGRQRPDLVSHVVVIGPVVNDQHRCVLAQGLALGLDSLRESPAANAMVLTDYIRCGIRWYAAQLGPMMTYPIERRVEDLRLPLLVVRGGTDHVAGRRWCRRLRDAAGRSRLVEIPGRPHHAQYYAPRAVASAIRDFVGAA
jgi:pimeloyl-ACP methyl ester carboxylesterase